MIKHCDRRDVEQAGDFENCRLIFAVRFYFKRSFLFGFLTLCERRKLTFSYNKKDAVKCMQKENYDLCVKKKIRCSVMIFMLR